MWILHCHRIHKQECYFITFTLFPQAKKPLEMYWMNPISHLKLYQDAQALWTAYLAAHLAHDTLPLLLLKAFDSIIHMLTDLQHIGFVLLGKK